jgi:hypothetical protein
MNYNNGLANYLTGPRGRFDLSDPSTQAMVRDVMSAPANAPKYGVSLPEIFQLHRALNAISSRTPQPQPTTVADDLKMAAVQAVQAPNAAPPQAQQMPPQGIQQAMPQAQMPQSPMDQGLGGMPAPAMDNAQFADGGIIAFADQGLVESDTSGTSREMNARILAGQQAARAAASVPTIQEGLAAVRAAREAAGITGKLGEERLKKLEGAASKDAEAEARSERFALAKAGFEMAAAAAKPGAKFLGSAAQGATAGLTDYAASQEKLRTLQEKRDAEIANIQNLQRAEDAGLVKDASGRIEKARDRIIDFDKSIHTTQTAIAGQVSQREGRREENAAQDERARLDRDARAREAGATRAIQLEIAKLPARPGVHPVQQILDLPTFKAAHGKKPSEEQLRLARELAQSGTPERTFAATEATYRAREKAFAESVVATPALRALRNKAAAGDEAAKREYDAAYETFVGRPPPGATTAGTGGSSAIRFDRQGNQLR